MEKVAEVTIDSGLRGVLSRGIIGVAPNGEAALEENKKLFDLIVKLKLPFDQLINEYNYDWVHVSFGARHRRQKLRAVKKNGRTHYINI